MTTNSVSQIDAAATSSRSAVGAVRGPRTSARSLRASVARASTSTRSRYNTALHAWDHGTPVLPFVVAPPRVTSAKLITDVEEWPIWSAKIVWPDLLNKHHAGPRQLGRLRCHGPTPRQTIRC